MEMGLTIPSSDQGEPITDTDAVADPEISAAQVADLAAYVASLPPVRPERTSPEGEKHFHQTGCAVCHQPEREGAYSDLCVHRMGAELASQKAETAAAGDEWRTAPLWGLRLRHRYLHDGRATSLDAAILLHGGEATMARDRYAALPESERAKLLDFLSTL
jgi:CxxC motif-containing protein (DUF1111 family)